ncbi:MAG: hypothetical protein DI603_03320 [Roseateles depolymerans]|uniref:CN hydrolase domain-containing protein n=1 Tax=Roseateles depolymerans TaxID=76731 RepID=A0A2W5G1J0_9BURK|nr:MAG: hypothetical protein DI603_03320 [Roseateles depolymerans]
MRVAVLQPAMHWQPVGNLRETLRALERAAAAGAGLLVGPELGLTGFHRQVTRHFGAGALAAELAQLQAACARLQVAAAVGLPWALDDGRALNSHLYIDAQGRLAGRVDKQGLTPSEATVFAAGGPRAWTALAGVALSSVLCRETLDGEALLPEWQASAPPGLRVLLWPSYIADGDTGNADEADLVQRYRQGACAMARALQAWVLQCNWPVSLNEPAARGFGASIVVAPDGRLVAELARDEPGLWCLALAAGAASITRLG